MSAEQFIIEHLDLWTEAVTTKSTSGRGSNGKIKLTGIIKLRELILELAVRGELVAQDPNDEPASALLQKVSGKRVEEHQRQSLSSEPSTQNQPFDLPDQWLVCHLKELAEVIRGVTYKKHQASDSWQEGYIALFRANNIQQEIACDSLIYIPPELAKETQMIRKGDILIAMSSGSSNLVGKAAQSHQKMNGTFGAFCAVIRPLEASLNSYLGVFTKAPCYRQQTQNSGKDIGINNLNKRSLESISVSLPPIPEQHRIVQKVDELMALCDRLEQQTHDQHAAHETLVDALLDTLTQSADADELADNWARLAAHFDALFTTEHSIDRLKQTIRQLAVMGRLVSQTPADQPASSLLDDILREKSRLIATERLRTTADESISDDEQYLEMPATWRWIRLGNTAKFIDYRGKTPTKTSTGKRLITAKNVRFGRIELQPEEFISDEDYKAWMTRGLPRSGDVLFTPEAPLGNAALNRLTEEFALAQRAICFQWHKPEISDFMLLQILANPFQEQLIENASGMTATGIKSAKLKEIPVVVPPLAEQARIVEKVDQLMATCAQLKTRLNQASKTRRQMADAVVEQALH